MEKYDKFINKCIHVDVSEYELYFIGMWWEFCQSYLLYRRLKQAAAQHLIHTTFTKDTGI
jgi:hypothetical protein